MARSFICSVIEPDTSIRQNITACVTGFGHAARSGGSGHRADRYRGSALGAAQLARELDFELGSAPRSRRRRRERGDSSRRVASISSWRRPVQRDAPRQAVAHGAQQSEIGRRAVDRIAGARQLIASVSLSLRFARSGSSRSSKNRSRNSSCDSTNAEIVLALAVGPAFAAATAARRPAAARSCRRRHIACCRAAR